jgi:MATE family multidrug resistance protein
VAGWIPALGVEGAGWATTLVRWAMLVAVVVYVQRHAALRPFRAVRHGLERALLLRIFKLGFPIGAQIGLEVGLFSLAAVMMGWLGPTELAAHQVTLSLAATTFMVALGASLAGSIRVGQHIGGGRQRAMRRAAGASYLLAMGFMGLCALLFLSLPRTLIGLYTSDPAVLALGSQLLLVAALFQLFDGAPVGGVGVLRGAGDTRSSMLLAARGYWGVGLPAAYLLGFHTPLGPRGVWLGLSAGLAVTALLLALRVRRTVRVRVRAQAA